MKIIISLILILIPLNAYSASMIGIISSEEEAKKNDIEVKIINDEDNLYNVSVSFPFKQEAKMEITLALIEQDYSLPVDLPFYKRKQKWLLAFPYGKIISENNESCTIDFKIHKELIKFCWIHIKYNYGLYFGGHFIYVNSFNKNLSNN